LDANDVGAGVAEDTGLAERGGDEGGKAAVDGSYRECRPPLDRLERVRRASEAGDRALAEALGAVAARQRSRRGDQALAPDQLPAPTTIAWRAGGMPPSHSHCSDTHDQTRFAISCARPWRGSRSSGRGNVRARPQRTVTRRGRIRQPLRMFSVPMIATGTIGA